MKTDDHGMVRAYALTKRYRSGRVEKTALRQVSLAIPRGEFWIVSGPSGSGKTTLLALLAGMIAPTEGEVVLDGKSITHLRDHHRALVRRNLVGMVFQEFALVAGMTLVENIFLPLVPQGGPGEPEIGSARALCSIGSAWRPTPERRSSASPPGNGNAARSFARWWPTPRS
jgi:putative ABC transport system ATP-binding protein